MRYSNVSRLIQYGVSTEGRPLYGLVISSVGTAFSKPLIFIDGGIHAREWIAPALALYIIQELLENPNNAEMVENADWFIAPVLNPDGYEFTFTNVSRFLENSPVALQREKGRGGLKIFPYLPVCYFCFSSTIRHCTLLNKNISTLQLTEVFRYRYNSSVQFRFGANKMYLHNKKHHGSLLCS